MRGPRRRGQSSLPICLLFGVVPALGGSGGEPASSPACQRLTAEGLENVMRIGPDLINGSAPEGERGFDSLQRLGVRTLICVDGGAPDVARAAARGIRCVHLPIGYDGIDEDEALKLMRAIRDLPKPIYLHCLHGKHRSPAAAAVAMAGLGYLPPGQAVEVLRTAGTSASYTGLYKAARSARPIESARLDEVAANFPERAQVTDFVQSMVNLGNVFERLEKLQEAGWGTPPDHPDLDSKHEAKIMVQLMEDLVAAETRRSRPDGFGAGLKDSAAAARGLAGFLDKGEVERSSEALEGLRASCSACHARFRD